MATAVRASQSVRTVRSRKTASQKAQETTRSVTMMVLSVALFLFSIVFMAAYAADLQQQNNNIDRQNKVLQAEIDSLNKKIDDATNIETVERIATKRLGMVQPDESNYITMKDSKDEDYHLADTIKEEAYD